MVYAIHKFTPEKPCLGEGTAPEALSGIPAGKDHPEGNSDLEIQRRNRLILAAVPS
jgi:hypothetical protein